MVMAAFGTANYGALLDNSDDEDDQYRHQNRSGAPGPHQGDTDGHLFAGSQHPPDVGVTSPTSGAFGAAIHGLGRPRDYQETLQGAKS